MGNALMAGTLLLTTLAVFLFFLAIYEPVGSFFRTKVGEYAEWLHEQLDSMFIEVPLARAAQIIAASTLGFGALALLLLSGQDYTIGWNIFRVILTIFFAYLGWRLPRTVLGILWNRRVSKFDDQMLDALTLMSNALKSGLSFVQAMDTVRRELPNPISQEFALVLRHQQLGGGVNESLQQLERRMGTEDVRIIVTAIMILRDTGGNLSETFDTIAFTIRERKKVKGKIQALTAQGVMQGVIIFFMPFVLGTILYVMDPVLISRMWTTGVGWVMLAFMAILQGVGGMIMKKVVTIQV